jgi:hypothetical protein
MRRKRNMAWFKSWEMHTSIGYTCREEADGRPTRTQKGVKRNLKGIECECGLASSWQHWICSLKECECGMDSNWQHRICSLKECECGLDSSWQHRISSLKECERGMDSSWQHRICSLKECGCGLDSTWQHRMGSLKIKHRYWHTCRLNTGQTSVKGYRYSFNREVEPKVWSILTRKIMERLLEVFLHTLVVYSIDTWKTRQVKLRKFSIHIDCTFIRLSSTELVNNGDVNWYR